MLQFFSSSNGVVNSRGAVDACLEDALGPEDTDCDLIIFYTTMGHNFDELSASMRGALVARNALDLELYAYVTDRFAHMGLKASSSAVA